MEATKDVELVVIFMIIPASFSVEACAVFAVLAAVSKPPDESYYSSHLMSHIIHRSEETSRER